MLDTILSIIAPYDCFVCGSEGDVLCADCIQKTVDRRPSACFKCQAPTTNYRVCNDCNKNSSVSSVWTYAWYTKNAKRLMHEFKFAGKRSAASDIAACLNNWLPATKKDCLVVAVPTASSHVRERGFDHAALLAKKFSAARGLIYVSALARTSQQRQLGLNRLQRLRNLADDFYVKNPKQMQNAHVLLIDDVTTTGASLETAANALIKAGSKRVDCIVFAQTPPKQ